MAKGSQTRQTKHHAKILVLNIEVPISKAKNSSQRKR